MKRLLNISIIVFLMLFQLSAIPVFGQSASLKTDAKNYEVGDHIQLELVLELPADFVPEWPEFETVFGKDFKLLKINGPNIDESGKNKIYNLTLTYSVYDKGEFTFESTPIDFRNHNRTETYAVRTNPLTINIKAPDVDLKKEIMDITGPEEIKYDIRYIIGAGVILLIILTIVAFLLIRYIKKRRANNTPFEAPAVRDPVTEAISSLQALNEAELWQAGLVKEHYSELSAILRIYISEVFGIKALEATTAEINGLIDQYKTQYKEPIDILLNFFMTADLVKFAKFEPGDHESAETINMAFSFIQETGNHLANQPVISNGKEVENA